MRTQLTTTVAAAGLFRLLVAAGIALVLLVPVSPFVASLPGTAQPVSAARSDAPVDCPKKIGGFKNHEVSVISEGHVQCYYEFRPGKLENGAVRLAVKWFPDAPGERVHCSSRDPEPVDDMAGGPEDFNRRIESSQRGAWVIYYVTPGKKVKLRQAEKAALKLLSAAEPLAHPCIPEDQSLFESAGFACPLALGDYVYREWYGDDPPTIVTFGRAPDEQHSFRCGYLPAYRDEGTQEDIAVSWLEGDPRNTSQWQDFCREQRDVRDDRTTIGTGTHPVLVGVPNVLAPVGGEAAGVRLAAVAADRTSLCPGATAPGAVDVVVTEVDDVDAVDVDRETELIIAGLVYIEAVEASNERCVAVNRTRRAAEAAAETGDTAASDDLLREAVTQQADSDRRFADDIAASREDFPSDLLDRADEVIATGNQVEDLMRQMLVLPMDSVAVDPVLERALEARRAHEAAKDRLQTALGLDPAAGEPGARGAEPELC